LREVDLLDADIILAERFPEAGLGRAINDRLQRAQAVFKK
jgi:L-threonylcarbamoyladenylate synthase